MLVECRPTAAGGPVSQAGPEPEDDVELRAMPLLPAPVCLGSPVAAADPPQAELPTYAMDGVLPLTKVSSQ